MLRLFMVACSFVQTVAWFYHQHINQSTCKQCLVRKVAENSGQKQYLSKRLEEHTHNQQPTNIMVKRACCKTCMRGAGFC